MHPDPRRIAPVVLAVVLLAGGYWWWQTQQVQAQDAGVAASGTIEATQIVIAAELGGRVTAVNAGEGQTVAAGAALVLLDDTLLRAQRAQASGALQQAQAGLAMARTRLLQAREGNSRPADVAAAEAAVALAQAQYDRMVQPVKPSQIDAARAAVAAAQAAYTAAKRAAGATDPQLDAALAVLEKAAVNLKVAQQNYDRVAFLPGASATPQSQALQAATIDYQQAEANYNMLAATSGPNAQSRLAAAAAQLAQARATLDQLEHPVTDADLAAAQANLDMARANLERLTGGATPNDVAIAQSAVDQAQGAVNTAEGALDVIDVQLARLTIASPIAGTVLARSIEPGEVAVPGGALLTIADLEHLTLTVYVSEDRYGLVRVGQSVTVRVDSFPGQTFGGSVVHIADQAEFTPRNVQTTSGRKTTVFAVKVAIENPGGRLKPGMPADVDFNGR